VANAVEQSTRDHEPDRVRQQAGSYRFGGVCQALQPSLANNVVSIGAGQHGNHALSSNPPSIGTYRLAARISELAVNPGTP
jgi:hypothetical protein